MGLKQTKAIVDKVRREEGTSSVRHYSIIAIHLVQIPDRIVRRRRESAVDIRELRRTTSITPGQGKGTNEGIARLETELTPEEDDNGLESVPRGDLEDVVLHDRGGPY